MQGQIRLARPAEEAEGRIQNGRIDVVAGLVVAVDRIRPGFLVQDLEVLVKFVRMIMGLDGQKKIGNQYFTFAPYEEIDYWKAVKGKLGLLVDRVYLQMYAGGIGNDLSEWKNKLGDIDPGLWCLNGSNCDKGDSPSRMKEKFSKWNNDAGISGGFVWLYDDIKKCSSKGTAADYAKAINTSTGKKVSEPIRT